MRRGWALPAGALAVDVASVLVFAALGRRTHEAGNALLGLLATAGPFLVALGLGWLVARAWREPLALRTGLVLWPVTVVGGLLVRAGFTGRLPVSFAVVVVLSLGVLLLGWRAVGAVVARRAASRLGR